MWTLGPGHRVNMTVHVYLCERALMCVCVGGHGVVRYFYDGTGPAAQALMQGTAFVHTSQPAHSVDLCPTAPDMQLHYGAGWHTVIDCAAGGKGRGSRKMWVIVVCVRGRLLCDSCMCVWRGDVCVIFLVCSCVFVCVLQRWL
jgi:hypothetical protein